MNKAEIVSYLKVSSSKSVVIDCITVDSLNGMVRTITIEGSANVEIAFDTWGYEEGGIYFYSTYESLDHLISDLENYIGRSIENWENYTKTGKYPEEGSFVPMTPEDIALAFQTNASLLPSSSNYEIHSDYWLELFRSVQT